MVCNVWFKNKDQAICPAECVNAVNRDERAFVKHGRMQDLLRGGGGRNFLWSGQVACRGSGAWRNHVLAKEVLGHAPPKKKKYIYIFK